MKTSKLTLHILYWLANAIIVLMLYSLLHYLIVYFPNTIKHWDQITITGGELVIIPTVIGILIMVLSFVPLFAFRSFMKNLKKDLTFTEKNIALLKKITFGLVAFDLFHILNYSVLFPAIFTIEGYPAPSRIPFQVTVLFFALLMWGLRSILLNGTRLQQENDLTI